MKYCDLIFYWYECRQADATNKLYFVINLITGNVVHAFSLSSSLKIAWLAYTLRTGEDKPLNDIRLEAKAKSLEGYTDDVKRWETGYSDYQDYDQYEWNHKQYCSNSHPLAYYIMLMQFSDLKKQLLRAGDYHATVKYRRSQKLR